MRGKLRSAGSDPLLRRITPADAGKTAAITIFAAVLWDHPRGCGENLSPKPLRLTSTGSPPRMRGKLSLFSGIVRITGITPADAGKTQVAWARKIRAKDHPRGCGENVYVFPCVRNKPGSPPRMRGKHCQGLLDAWLTGITPADAGKTFRCGYTLDGF